MVRVLASRFPVLNHIKLSLLHSLSYRQTPGAGRRSAGITRQYQACTVTWPAAAARLEEGQDGSGSEVETVMQYVQCLTCFLVRSRQI